MFGSCWFNVGDIFGEYWGYFGKMLCLLYLILILVTRIARHNEALLYSSCGGQKGQHKALRALRQNPESRSANRTLIVMITQEQTTMSYRLTWQSSTAWRHLDPSLSFLPPPLTASCHPLAPCNVLNS